MEKENMSLYDSVSTGLAPGLWTITTSQELTNADGRIQTDGLSCVQQILVECPVFGVKQEAIVQRTPLPGSQGVFTDMIAHLVTKGFIDAREAGLFLLLLKKEEIVGRRECTAEEYRKADPSLIRSSLPETLSMETLGKTVSCIQMRADLLERLLPDEKEFPYFCHYRQVYTASKPEMDLDGIFTVFLANRLPEYEDGTSTCYEAHLTSVRGLWNAERTNDQRMAELLSLDHWEFTVSGKSPQGFQKICERMKEDLRAEWMYRLPDIADDDHDNHNNDEMESVRERLRHGFVPLEYQTRLQDQGICWGRSAFLPCRAQAMEKRSYYETADAALCYDETDCMFDVTYAAAFEAGRMAAVSDGAYMEALFAFRQEMQKKLDRRYMDQIWKFGEAASDSLGQLFAGADWRAAGEAFPWSDMENMKNMENRSPLKTPVETKAELERFLREHAVNASTKLGELAAPVTDWLAKLLLLYPLPADQLLLHDAALPKESIRFFYLDPNWQQALLEGALSIGLYSRRQSLFNQVMRELLSAETRKAMYAYRAGLYGQKPPDDRGGPWTGFLLHAEVAALWPTLSVDAWDRDGRKLAILRMQHLRTGLLLALFDGIAEKIIVNEPEECLCLRLDTEKYRFFRENSTVLRLAPERDDGLLGALKKEDGQSVGPAAFARHFMTLGQRTVFGREK